MDSHIIGSSLKYGQPRPAPLQRPTSPEAPGGQEVREGTWERRVAALGNRGRLNFFWELTAAGKGGAENMAATTLMRVIQDCICSRLLGKQHGHLGLGPGIRPAMAVPAQGVAREGTRQSGDRGGESAGDGGGVWDGPEEGTHGA